MLNGFPFRHLQPVHDGFQPIPGENTQQGIIQGQVEAGRTRIPLTPGPAPELVVDTPGFVAFGTDDVQTSSGQHLVVTGLPGGLDGLHLLGLFCVGQGFVSLNLGHLLIHIAAQHDVRAPAGHVGGDGNHPGLPGFRHDIRFPGVLLGVQHLVGQLFLIQQLGQELGIFDGGGPHQHGLAPAIAFPDVRDNGRVLFLGRAIHLILQILPLHWPMGRNHHGLQTVDFHEFVSFRVGGTGHAGQLAVHAEVVLEGDGGQGLVLVLDFHPFLGFHGLMQAVGPAPSRHQTAGEFVHDDHFPVLHHVLLVPQIEGVGPEGGIQVVHQNNVGGVVEAAAFGEHAHAHQNFFHVFMALLGEIDLVGLFIHPVIPGSGLVLGPHQLGRHLIEADIKLGLVFGLAGNNQGGPGFVDEDGVHLIHDGVIEAPLHPVFGGVDHVVPQIVEAEFVISTVGDVGGVGSLLGIVVHLGQIHPHGESQEAMQPPHPFRVPLGQVVIHRDDMDPLAGDGIEVGRQGSHQGFAFPGAHFGNFAMVQHHAPDQLHIEVAHAQHPLTRFPYHSEGFRQQVVQALALGVALSEFLRLGL